MLLLLTLALTVSGSLGAAIHRRSPLFTGDSNTWVSSNEFCGADEHQLQQISFLHIDYDVFKRCDFGVSTLSSLKELIVRLKRTELEEFEDHTITSTNTDFEPQDTESTLESMHDELSDIMTNREHISAVELWHLLNSSFPLLEKLQVMDESGANVLHYSIIDNTIPNKIETLDSILSSGKVNVNTKENYANTPLHYCLIPDAKYLKKSQVINTMDCLRVLLKHGADPNIMNDLGFTAVHLAAGLSYAEPLKLLVENGGDLEIRYSEEDGDLIRYRPSALDLSESRRIFRTEITFLMDGFYWHFMRFSGRQPVVTDKEFWKNMYYKNKNSGNGCEAFIRNAKVNN